MSIFDFYKNKSFNFSELKINKANFYFDKENLNLFRNHFNKKINKIITIKNSNIFYKDINKDIVSISPIKKLKYIINFTTKEKKLDIDGIIFDSKYNFLWYKNYQNPDKRQIVLKIKNPNIKIDNVINNQTKNGFEGNLKLRFIGSDYDFKYKKLNDLITFKSSSNNDKFKFKGDVNIDPLYFNINSKVKNLDIEYLINYFLISINKSNNLIHKNLNGDLSFNLSKMKNSFFKNGNINFIFREGNILIDKSYFNIDKVGNINFSDGFFKIYEDNLYYSASANLEIKNQKEFYRLFLIPTENRIKLSNINFIIEKNLDQKKYYISNLKINYSKNKKYNNDELEKFEFNNVQQLRLILRNYFTALNQG